MGRIICANGLRYLGWHRQEREASDAFQPGDTNGTAAGRSYEDLQRVWRLADAQSV